jgi:Xaa-Pro aminopeptidase
MVNCSRMMDEVRWIKTEAEVAQQKRAADLLDDVLAEIFPTIREGETEREVHARVLAACTRRGAGYVHGILNSSSNEVMYGGESDVRFRNGDFVRNDYVAYFNGCPGHQSRLAILGRPSAGQMRGYELTLEIHRKTIDQCRAGVTAGEIYGFTKAEFEKKGIGYTASLVGHGIGPWFHQQEPVLRQNSDIVLEKGMILAVEPQRLHWHLQDLILVGGWTTPTNFRQISDRSAIHNRGELDAGKTPHYSRILSLNCDAGPRVASTIGQKCLSPSQLRLSCLVSAKKPPRLQF